MKFGAEELFNSEEDNEPDLQVDIDDILNRAETRVTEENNTAANELLSQFKVSLCVLHSLVIIKQNGKLFRFLVCHVH